MSGPGKLWVSEDEVIHTAPVFRKRIVERWGTGGGDVREYYIGVTNKHGWISVGSKRIEFSKEVFKEIPTAIQDVLFNQSVEE